MDVDYDFYDYTETTINRYQWAIPLDENPMSLQSLNAVVTRALKQSDDYIPDVGSGDRTTATFHVATVHGRACLVITTEYTDEG